MFTQRLTLAALVLALIAPAVRAAVETNPALFTGANAIDPSSNGEDRDSDATGVTSQATLEAMPNFVAVHDFTNFASGTGTTNVIAFDSPSYPDIKFNIALTGNASGGAVTVTANLVSSTSNSVYLGSSNLSYTIDFGSYNPTTTVFTSNVNAVEAAAFMIVSLANGKSLTATYFDDAGNTLATQVGAGGSESGAGQEVYFGYRITAGQAPIGRIVIGSPTGGSLGSNTGFDDLGFTIVPTPAALPAGLALMGFLAMRRGK
ncbi:MAG: hypothetical protein GC162_12345 [Planctomycetes bacterium]|nr:hypothetical protein [Planctomycetota bacterium]